MPPSRLMPILGGVLLLLIFAAELFTIISANQGTFTYTLDDPYIHLALAQNIAQGHYGINLQDYSSPASSIIWPLLLSPFAGWSGFVLVPLILNMFFALASYAVIYQSLRLVIVHASPLRLMLLGVLLTLGVNGVGLALNGMEHNLHQLCSLLIMYALIKIERDEMIPPWLYPVLVLNPLVRPEGLALSFLAIAYLLWKRRAPLSLLSALLIVAGYGGFGWYLLQLGLDPVPSSIQVKSAAVDTGREVGNRLDVLKDNLTDPEGWIVLIATILCFIPGIRRQHPLWRVSVMVALCGLAHILFGRMAWFARYEAYIIAPLFVMIVLVYWQGLANLWNRRPWLQRPLFVLVAYLMMSPYLLCALISPGAAHNIYQQHYQLHRIAQEYFPHNIAANDIGYISLNNNNYILDLYGLAYKKAFEQRISADNPEWMQMLVEQHQIKLAMLHDIWFERVPAQWVKLGTLTFSGTQITPVDREVSIYATSAAFEAELTRVFEAYAASTPPDVQFIFAGETAPQ